MTILLIDSGNSAIKWATLKNNDLSGHGQLVHGDGVSLQHAWSEIERPDCVVVANVAGEAVEQRIRQATQANWVMEPRFLTSTKSCCGLTNGYDDPLQLGVDRWLAAIAAWHLAGGAAIVVDCGTAVTIDLVDDAGVFRGGVIMAGLAMTCRALRDGTHALDEYCSGETQVVATSTATGVVSGALLGLAGAIERIVREQSTLVDSQPVVYLSGGDAQKLLLLMNIQMSMRPDLVLQGLRIYCESDKGENCC